MGETTWCKYCSRNCIVHHMHSNGYICCVECGRVLEHYQFKEEVNFTKGPGGACQMDGSFVNSVESDLKESFKRTLNKGKKHIQKLAVLLDMNDENLIKQANQFYRIVIERYKFTGGRNTEHVAGACLYIACRYVLGAVYLQLCILLSFQKHGFVQTIVDPSLFMHRFTYDLLKDESNKVKKMVLKTALLIVASMKRDWMQTGRKPSGICGAALYIAALSHGYTYSKTEIMKRVHICEATLTGRLIEFEKTSSGSLTIEEFTQKAEEFEMEKCSGEMSKGKANKSDEMKLTCKHKDSKPYFAHGLCKGCYEDFIDISGGLSGGSEPPSFQVAEMERLARASAQKEGCSVEVNDKGGENACNTKKGVVPEAERASMPGNIGAECNDSTYKDGEIPSVDETENLSDIDDMELNCYLASKEESRLKKIIWEEMNKEYLQEQAAAAAYMKDLGDATKDVLQARKLAYAANTALGRKRELRRRKREEENASTPQTAAEATRQMLQKRGLSSKINYDNLDNLFDDLPLNTKKVDAQPQDDSNITEAKQAKTEENAEGAKKRALDVEEENDETIEEGVGKEEEEEEEEDEVYEHATYDQNEYYCDEDDSFYD